jgi:hypothetical protein
MRQDFQLCFGNRISGLGGIGRFWGLDKILRSRAKSGNWRKILPKWDMAARIPFIRVPHFRKFSRVSILPPSPAASIASSVENERDGLPAKTFRTAVTMLPASGIFLFGLPAAPGRPGCDTSQIDFCCSFCLGPPRALFPKPSKSIQIDL